MTWRFENTGVHHGSFNMQYDETLATSVLNGTSNPTVRVYAWDPPAISLGWSQSEAEVDIRKAMAERIDVVRRPTGGRAILHADELTYSVVMPAGGRNTMVVYDHISRALVHGLKEFGVDAKLEKRQVYFPAEYVKASSAACFTSTARFEILVAGKKLVGSAQRRYSKKNGEEVVLQHGSILLDSRHKRIAEFLRVSETERILLQKELEDRTTDLSSLLGRHLSFDEIADAVRTGFEEEWHINFERVSEPLSIAS